MRSLTGAIVSAILTASPALGAGAQGLGREDPFDVGEPVAGNSAFDNPTLPPAVASRWPNRWARRSRSGVFTVTGKHIQMLPIDQKLEATRIR
jgi:hypothetical protein